MFLIANVISPHTAQTIIFGLIFAGIVALFVLLSGLLVWGQIIEHRRRQTENR